MDRRQFLKITGAGSALALAGCAPKKAAPAADDAKVVLRTNPRNGDQTSLLGYGCMRWPMIKDAEGKDIIDQEAVNEMVDYAMAHGINYFDTSPAYLQGLSEQAAGIALGRYPRESYFLATKLSNFGDTSPEASKKMYEDSFRHFNTDYLDYYLFHAIGRGGVEAFNRRYVENGMLPFIQEERKKGRIRNLGFSFHGNTEAFDSFMRWHDEGTLVWDFVMIQMNYVDWKHADPKRNANADYLYAELEKRGLPVMVMEPLRGGRLADVPAGIATRMKEREPDLSPASWAFRFVASHPAVQVVLSGMSAMEPLEENCRTFSDFHPLTDEELAFMEEMAVLMQEYPLVDCTDCQYCMPCPWGIDIPGIFRHYNAAITDGTFAASRDQKDYSRLKRAFLVRYDRSIPTLRQADHCIACGECLSHCPQSIPIPRELQRINRYVEKLKQDTL